MSHAHFESGSSLQSSMTQTMPENTQIGSRALGTWQPRCISRSAVEAMLQMKTGDPTLFAREIRLSIQPNGLCNSRNLPSLCTIKRIIRNQLPLLPTEVQVTSRHPTTSPTTEQSASRCPEESDDSWYRSFTWDSPQPSTTKDQEESSQHSVISPTTEQSASQCCEETDDSWYRSFTWDSPQPSTANDQVESSQHSVISPTTEQPVSQYPEESSDGWYRSFTWDSPQRLTAKDQEETHNENSTTCHDDWTAPSRQVKPLFRFTFSPQQIATLEKEFERSPYPGMPERRKVADLVGIDQGRVHMWFRNRRAKLRRERGISNLGRSSSLILAPHIGALSNVPKASSMVVPNASVPPEPVVPPSGHPDPITNSILSLLSCPLPLANHRKHTPLTQSVCSRLSVSSTATLSIL